MKILGLKSENVKRIQLVELTLDPAGNVVIVRGRNGQGKTSLIDTIMLALGGKGVQPPEVIRKGADHAMARLDLGEFTVERKWTSDTESHLVVKSAAGGKYPSPQTFLDKLVGPDGLGFDPLAFMRLPRKEREETLARIVGLDFSKLEASKKEHFDNRTGVNRDVKALESRLAVLPLPPASSAPVDFQDLLDEQEMLEEAKRDNDKVRTQHREALHAAQVAAGARSRAGELLAEQEKRLAEARAEFERRERELEQQNLLVDAVGQRVKALVDPDLAGVRERIRQAQANAAAASKHAERQVLERQLSEKTEASIALSEAIARIDAEREKRLAETKFPVPGLSFNINGSITLNELPLEQASQAEQLRVAVAMAIALNPKLRVLLVRDASLLDAQSLQLVTDMAAAADVQVFLEMVGEEGPGIVIEDGRVAEAKTKAS